MAAIFSETKLFLKIRMATLWVKNFIQIALFITVSEI